MSEPGPSSPSVDWTTQFDHFSPAYAADPFSIWATLRDTCPVARSGKFRGMLVPTRHEDIEAVARNTEAFSSRSPLVAEFAAMSDFGIMVPPISSDPPHHTSFRKLLLPFFSPQRIEGMRPGVVEHCDELIDAFADAGSCDAAVDYAQHIPVRVIASMLGIPKEDGDRFRGWVHSLLELGPTDIDVAAVALFEMMQWFGELKESRRIEPTDDLVSFLLSADIDGRPLDDWELFGGFLLLLVAGIDTTWSAIGATLWHLGGHADDQRRLRSEPGLWVTAGEELLRAYAPVTMAREVVQEAEIGGCPAHVGAPILLAFPAANRDPEAFDRPDEVILDREQNRHFAFGVGIHRCLGSNLARMELQVATERFLARIPEFTLADPDAVRWSTGQVRGPRILPLSF